MTAGALESCFRVSSHSDSRHSFTSSLSTTFVACLRWATRASDTIRLQSSIQMGGKLEPGLSWS